MPVQSTHANVLSWASDLEQNTIEQAERSAALPVVAAPVALMPDAHFGYGATVGSVIPTDGAVIPSAVGVDIGCGMIAVETPLTSASLPDDLSALHAMFTQAVPAGVGQGHGDASGNSKRDRRWHRFTNSVPSASMTQGQANTAFKQFGSLGGGNHFLEVCLDERDVVWVVLHSGSRGIGNQLATGHIKAVRKAFKDEGVMLSDPDLAYLLEGTPEFDAYITDMLWAQAYAMENRNVMMDSTMAALESFLGGSVPETQRINCHHNFTQREAHVIGGVSRSVWLTRKGAIQARTGDLGVIPGSMGAATFIVEGLGNPASYFSCSHGAGRKLGRKQAERVLSMDEFIESMAGKTWDSTKADQLLDEAPGAYKDIYEVMANQADLVRPVHLLSQILNMKGTK